jgi:hypothetical protein
MIQSHGNVPYGIDKLTAGQRQGLKLVLEMSRTHQAASSRAAARTALFQMRKRSRRMAR